MCAWNISADQDQTDLRFSTWLLRGWRVCNIGFVWTTNIPLINYLINYLGIPPALSTLPCPLNVCTPEPITAELTPMPHLLCSESQTIHLKKQATLSGHICEKHNKTWIRIRYLHRTLVCERKTENCPKGRLQFQHTLFTKATAKSDAGVNASFVVAEVSKCLSVCQETPSQTELRKWQTIRQHSWPKSHTVTWLFH